MGRLREARPRLKTATSRLSPAIQADDRAAREAARHRQRDADIASRAWYKTARWRALRWSVLVDARFTCAACGARHASDTSHLVGDHIQPHRGDETLFWDRGNLQCLCRTCHDRTKQATERDNASAFDDLLTGLRPREGGGKN